MDALTADLVKLVLDAVKAGKKKVSVEVEIEVGGPQARPATPARVLANPRPAGVGCPASSAAGGAAVECLIGRWEGGQRLSRGRVAH